MDKKELRIRKIKDGTVIDHITPGYALKVIRVLGINEESDDIVSIAMNVPSGKKNQKDIVKVEDRELESDEIDKISLIAPNATINIIKEYEIVEKQKVNLPDQIRGVVVCSNNSCISNTKEPIDSEFRIIKKEPVKLKCMYCGNLMEGDISNYLK